MGTIGRAWTDRGYHLNLDVDRPLLKHDSMGDWPTWLNLLIATLLGVIGGVGVCVKWMWTISDRILTLEKQMGPESVQEQLRKDRHDNIYPMIQVQVFAPLDKIEAEQKAQGQNIAILLDRDRIEKGLGEVVSTVHRIAETARK